MIRSIAEPENCPVESTGTDLPAIPAERLSAAGLRTRFAQAQTLAWTPEARETPVSTRELRLAAVLIALVLRKTGPTVLFTRRAAHLHDHAGQISFPGGRREPDDADAVATALREAHEEIGLAARHVEVLGTLPDYVTGSGFRIAPVVALVHEPFDMHANAVEVAGIFEVPLAFLMHPAHHELRVFRAQGEERRFFAMPYPATTALPSAQASPPRHFIWGATAGMLRNLYRFLSAQGT